MTGLSGNSLSDRIAQMLINEIVLSDMQSGDKLPSERELAEHFKTGRPAVREAIRALSILNIVEIRPYDGLYIAEFDPKVLMYPFKVHMEMGRFSMMQLYELRTMLEVEAAGIASQKLSDEQIAQIVEVVNSEDVRDPVAFAKADEWLHQEFYNSAGNFLLQMLNSVVHEWCSVGRQITNSLDKVREIAHKDHLQIVVALQERDQDTVREAMRQHIQNLAKIEDISDRIYYREFMRQLQDEFSDDLPPSSDTTDASQGLQ